MLTMTNEKAILDFARRNYMDPVNDESRIPNYLIKRGAFETATYQHFTVKELIKYLKKNPQYDIVTGTFMFRQKIFHMLDRTKIGSDPAHLFATMYDTLSEVADFLLSR